MTSTIAFGAYFYAIIAFLTACFVSDAFPDVVRTSLQNIVAALFWPVTMIVAIIVGMWGLIRNLFGPSHRG